MMPQVDTTIMRPQHDTRRNEALRQAATAYVGSMLEQEMAGRAVQLNADGTSLAYRQQREIGKQVEFYLVNFLNAFSGAVYVPDMRAGITWDAIRMSVNVKVWIV